MSRHHRKCNNLTMILFLVLTSSCLMHLSLMKLALSTSIIHPLSSLKEKEKQYPLTKHIGSPLNDKTLKWNVSQFRHWWRPKERINYYPQQKWEFPSDDEAYMITMTNLGWNQPNQTKALKSFYRSFRSLELYNRIINHPSFHPTAWQDIIHILSQKNTASSSFHELFANVSWLQTWHHHQETKNQRLPLRIYIFLDVEVCAEQNYPHYGRGLVANADTSHGLRTTDYKNGIQPVGPIQFVMKQLTSIRNMQHHDKLLCLDPTLVIFDCGGWGPEHGILQRQQPNQRRRRRRDKTNEQSLYLPSVLSLASLSASPWHHNTSFDLGFPPPPIHRLTATSFLCNTTTTTNRRPYLLGFAGNFRAPVRQVLRKKVHNGRNIFIVHGNFMRHVNWTYSHLLEHCIFGAVPRGDNLFSYRLLEVMSAGTIPVIYANDWVLPFQDLIDWKQIAVLIDENEAEQTRDILSKISPRQRCRMQQNMLAIYHKYFVSTQATIDGLLENLQYKWLKRIQNYTGTHKGATIGS